MNKILILLFSLLWIKISAQDKNYVRILPTDSQREIVRKAANVVPSPRQLRWQKLELTAFFHFGINTFTGREWGTGDEDPGLFDPDSFDARQWIRIVKSAGFKQVILTAKHHDGFCLWPTKTTTHSVAASPWMNGKGDVVKAVSDACREYGLGFGVYLSPWDRNASVYGSDTYNDFFVRQLTELLTQYGRIDEVWFDGANGEGPNGKKQMYDFDRWYKVIRQLQPSAVIAIMGPDVRWVGTETGYGRETEWSVVPVNNLNPELTASVSQTNVTFKPTGDMRGDVLGSRAQISQAKALVWYPAETDVSIRPGWFYHSTEDDKVKTPEKLMDIYFNSVGRNGVLLLNIPPNKQGRISKADSISLIEWHQKIDSIFHKNLAENATITVLDGEHPEYLLDGDSDSHLTLPDNDTTVTIEIDLPAPVNTNLLLLQEDISKGQRVEEFALDYWNGNQWENICNGTTIGYKRLLQFEPVNVQKLRLKILSSRMNPFLSEIGFYWTKH
jgi:alpha-L-fucosidase